MARQCLTTMQKTERLILILVLIFAVGRIVRAQDTPPPLTKADILGRLAAGSSPSYVAHLVSVRGISFAADDRFLAMVRDAGGEGVLETRLGQAFSGDQDSLRANDNDAQVHIAACAALQRSGELGKADAECQAAIAADPANPFPLLATSVCLAQRRYGPEENGDVADESSASSEEPPTQSTVLDPASLAQQAARMAPDLAQASVLSSAASFVKDPSSASSYEDAITKAAKDDPAELDVALLPGNVPLVSIAIGSGVQMATGGDGPQSLYVPGQVDQDDPTLRKEIEALQRILGVEPAFAPARRLLAVTLWVEGKQQEAIGAARQAEELEPGVLDSHNLIVDFLQQLKSASDSESVDKILYEIASEQREELEIQPSNAEFHGALAETLAELKDNDGAVAEYRECLNLFPQEFNCHQSLTKLYENAQEFDEEIQEERRYIGVLKSPDDAQEKLELARILENAGLLAAAADECDEVLSLDPDNAAAHDQLGWVRRAQGYLDDAIAEYRTAIKLDADNQFWGFHFDLAYTLSLADKTHESVSEYQEVLKSAPDDPWTHNNLAWLYATTKDTKYANPTEALTEANKAVGLSEWKEPGIVDTLAQAYFANGKYADAVETEKKALLLDPDNSQLKAQLARFTERAQQSPASKQGSD